MTSRFLFNATLWDELRERIPRAKRVCAAVAYLGRGASRVLPLKEGDRLVVDMSLRTVRAGATDPREVQKFLRRGVQVFSRGSLHAKFFIIDEVVLAGSANISQHAQATLDEAAILTNDVAAVRRASATFKSLCTEPVLKSYLARCIEEYRPPTFVFGEERSTRRKGAAQAKLWIVGGLRYLDLPEKEATSAERIVKRLSKTKLAYERTEVDYLHYPSKQKYFSRLREGDWLITCTKAARGFDVAPPGRFLGLGHYSRGGGKNRYLVAYEIPTGATRIRWSQLRTATPSIVSTQRAKPRTTPVLADAEADALLRLWNANGKFRR